MAMEPGAEVALRLATALAPFRLMPPEPDVMVTDRFWAVMVPPFSTT